MSNSVDNFYYSSESLEIKAREAPWDSSVFGYPVALIEHIKVYDLALARQEFSTFRKWIDFSGLRIISCRLSCQKMVESFLLEENNFRFIETVLHPVFDRFSDFEGKLDQDLRISPSEFGDLVVLREIAERAFTNERYYVDPRVDKIQSGQRYGRWVISAHSHSSQQLLKVTLRENIIAFFIIELFPNGKVYWHLTAINPDYQGLGYGRRVWTSMLARHSEERIKQVSTTIASRNVPVLNLYSSLNFRFTPPETTFHWVRDN